ncbi:ABC transporter ATP-binding protein [Rhodococcus sp. USK13]|uniref:ABC transporter ATP-binding protein n=1 Tax=Rhodococcus sp. USK13 TaxID=2806442 RepID=UPI001BCB00F1|nr:ABC transporter ATP-binding protein [Rhodococcus sp. USK13]
MTGLGVQGLRAQLGSRDVLHGVDFAVRPGELLGLVGPNGSGKTTALRCCYRAVSATAGAVVVGGVNVADLARRQLARTVGAVPQEPQSSTGVTVRESVSLGRIPHQGWFERDSAADREIVERSLQQVGLAELAGRDVQALSGGERQRVAIARALTQQPRVLLLDEPTNHLDLRHQLILMEFLRDLAAGGLALVVTMHDLRLAVQYCDTLAVMQHGRVITAGPPPDVLDDTVLGEVFGIRAVVRSGPRRSMDILGLADG